MLPIDLKKGVLGVKRYKIEEVASACGLTKRTIRYYEEIGLLFPPDRSEGGYRLYGDKHVERLKQITMARDVLGVSLQELQEYIAIVEALQLHRQGAREAQDRSLKLNELEEMERIASDQLRLIDQKMEKLTRFRDDVVSLQRRIQEAKHEIRSIRE